MATDQKGCYSQWCNTYLSRFDRIFVNLPWLRHVIFIAILMSSKILVNVPIPWLHRFKLPNLGGNLSPRVEEGGYTKERVKMEREHMEMMLSIHWRMTHGLSVSHNKSLNHKKHTKF